jgi:hypothetical protein
MRSGSLGNALVTLLSLLASLTGHPAAAETDEELAKKLANPVSSLISVPWQSNFDFGFEDNEGFRYTGNFQPVIPFSVSERWNVISRTILPVIYQEQLVQDGGSLAGIGDTTQSFFLSPKEPGPGGLIWGVGPAFLLDTSTRDELGSDQWGAGPTFVVLRQHAGWTYGMLANHLWEISKDESPRSTVDATFLQPFLNHTWKNGFGITVQTESTYDWTGDQWTVPINLFLSQVFALGGQRLQVVAGGRHYAETPPGGPDWGLRLALVLLLPR